MGSLFKIAFGMALGAGIAILVAKREERQEDLSGEFGLADDVEVSGIKARLQHAGVVAQAARSEREAALQQVFRSKVSDPAAFAPKVEDTLV